MRITGYIIAFILLLGGIVPMRAASPKRELRGVWLATVWGIDWPSRAGTTAADRAAQQAQLREMLDRIEALNLTTVFFQVRSMADAMYESSLEPWSGFVSGRRGVSPGWDPLRFAVEECHARGLECYAWVNPFRWSAGADYDAPADRRAKERGWLLTYGKYTVLNPALEEVRQHIVAVCKEIVEGYEVDGLVFDDYFYPNRIPETKDAADYPLYQAEASWMTFGDWRRANVHKAIADVKAMVEETRPDIRFGISPAGVAGKADTSAKKWGVACCDVKAADWQYNEIYSDPLGLLYQGTVDFISPQLYWPTTHATAPFAPLAKWWNEAANFFDRHFYASVTLERLDNGDPEENCRDLLRQIQHNRLQSIDGSGGFVIYSAKWLPRVEDYLVDGPFALRSLPPRRCGEEPVYTDGPRGLVASGKGLSWKGIGESRGVRYTVYEVPRSMSREDAMEPDGDGINVEYLLGITYTPGFEVKRDKGCRYAVCVLDGNSAESAPSWLD